MPERGPSWIVIIAITARILGVMAFALFANTVGGLFFGMGFDQACHPAEGRGCGAASPLLAGWIALSVACPLIMLVLFNRSVIKLRNFEKLFHRPAPAAVIGWGAIALAIVMTVLGLLTAVADTSVSFFPGNLPRGLGLMVLVAAFPGITEELAYRWIVYDYARRYLPRGAAAGLSGLLFGVIHLNQVGGMADGVMLMLAALTVTFLFAALYDWAGTIWAPIVMHWVWDTFFLHIGVSVSSNYAPGGQLEPGSIDASTSEFMVVSYRFASSLVSGGEFGVDSSPVAILIFAACAAAFWRLPDQKEQGTWIS